MSSMCQEYPSLKVLLFLLLCGLIAGNTIKLASVPQNMAPFKIVFMCIIFKVQLYLSRSSLVELTSGDVDGFVKTPDTRVIYFETKVSLAKYPVFAQEYAEAAKSLDSYGVQLGKVDCSTEEHKRCSDQSDPSLFVFRDGNLVKSLLLERVDDEHSIVANILHRFLLLEELAIVQSEDDFKEILVEAKGKNNVLLANIQSIGMKGHRYLLEVAFTFGDSFKFYLSTKLPMDMFGDKSKVKVFLCKKNQCEVRHYDGDFSIIPLTTFLQSVTLPGAIILGKDETIPYNKDSVFPVNIVYVFVKDKKDVEDYREELEGIAKTVKVGLGIIIVQIEKHLTFIKQFGLAEDSGFPALAFISSDKVQENGMDHVDVFTSHDKVLQKKEMSNFLNDLIKTPATIFGSSVETRSLTVHRFVEYVTVVKENQMEFLFVAFCDPSDDACSSFIFDYQRLSRTFDRHFERTSSRPRDVKFAIILDENANPKFKIDSYPALRLHRKGQPFTEFTPYTGIMIYDEMLEFVKHITGLAHVLTLPWSGLDYIELTGLRTAGEQERLSLYGGDNESDSSEPEPEPEDEYEKTPEETEDDEVAAAGYEIYYTKAVNDQHVPKLNDTSFNSTRQQYDIAVIFFFLPWDARSQAFSPSYAAAAKTLVKPDGSGTKIGALQVNCFDWEDVCRKENVKLHPTIRIYRKNKPVIDYRGILDEPSLVRTVKLLQSRLPVKLTSNGEAVGFEVGKFPMPSILYTEISVLGLFALESSEQVSIFLSAARKMEGQQLFGYATGKVASDSSQRLGVNVPSIILIKRNDPLESKVIFEEDYTDDAIVNFVKHSSLPLFGELSPSNFPIYSRRGQPFLIAFKKKDNVKIHSLISDVVKSGKIHGVSFCWVDISVKVNREILQAYTKNKTKSESLDSAVVFVNHKKGKTYIYEDKLQIDSLVVWIKRCSLELEDFTGELNKSEWKPRLEGYDFLAKMKEEAKDDADKDRWATSGSEEENEDTKEGDEANDEDDNDQTSSRKSDKDHHNARFHAAFHAKKKARVDQRQSVVPDSTHSGHTEL